MSHSMMPYELYTARNHPNSIQTHRPPHCLTGHFWLHWEYLFLPKNCEILIVYSCATPSATSHEPHLFSSLLCPISPSPLILLTISPQKFQILQRRKPHPHLKYSHTNCMSGHSFQAWAHKTNLWRTATPIFQKQESASLELYSNYLKTTCTEISYFTASHSINIQKLLHSDYEPAWIWKKNLLQNRYAGKVIK